MLTWSPTGLTTMAFSSLALDLKQSVAFGVPNGANRLGLTGGAALTEGPHHDFLQ